MRRYYVKLPPRSPAAGYGVYGRGAVVDGDQTGFHPKVHPNHGLEVGHKFYLMSKSRAVMTGRIFTVGMVGHDWIGTVLPRPFAWTDGDVLVPLGHDTNAGMSAGTLNRPALDGGVQRPLTTDKAIDFYGDGKPVWIVLFDSKSEPLDVLMDVQPLAQVEELHA